MPACLPAVDAVQQRKNWTIQSVDRSTRRWPFGSTAPPRRSCIQRCPLPTYPLHSLCFRMTPSSFLRNSYGAVREQSAAETRRPTRRLDDEFDVVSLMTSAARRRCVDVHLHGHCTSPVIAKFHYAIWFEPASNQIA